MRASGHRATGSTRPGRDHPCRYRPRSPRSTQTRTSAGSCVRTPSGTETLGRAARETKKSRRPLFLWTPERKSREKGASRPASNVGGSVLKTMPIDFPIQGQADDLVVDYVE